MICTSVAAENFRNIESCRVEFSPGVNILLGDNAQGKTNLIEAIYFAAIGKSFRGAHEADFLRMGDVTLFNPGSAGMGRQTYGRITVKGTEFKCEILSL